MKIVIPFDVEKILTKEETAALDVLHLDISGVVDQVLDHWLTYVFGSVENAYEQTMDDVYEHIHLSIRDLHSREKAELLMADQADLLANIFRGLAFYLKECLVDIPYEVNQIERTSENPFYTFMRVLEINHPGKFLILTTQSVSEHQ